MSSRFFIGIAWATSARSITIPAPEIPDPNPPGDGDVDPPPDPEPPVEPEEETFFNLLSTHNLVATFAEVGGALVDLEGGAGGSWLGTGTVQRSQPSLLTDDPQLSFGLGGNVWGNIPYRSDLDLSAFTVLVVAQRRTSVSYSWMNLASRDEQLAGASQQGGWSLAITNAGAPRWSIRSADTTATVIAGSSNSISAGDTFVIGGSAGAAGQRLYLGSSIVATDALIQGSAAISALEIGTYRAGGSTFNGAINLVAVLAKQLSEAEFAALAALAKTRVRFANDFSASVQEGFTTDVDVIPKGLMASAAPTIAITAQPTNATAAVVDGKIQITGVTA